VIVHTAAPGYGQVKRYATEAAGIAGTWVNVITDDAPSVRGIDAEPL
jgi:hypothetical protein